MSAEMEQIQGTGEGTGQPVSEPSLDQGASGAPSAPPAEPLYEVKVDGQVQKVPLNELLNGYQRQAAFTRKTQELAQRERAYREQLAQYERAIGEVRQLLSDRERLNAYLQQAFPAPIDPQELLTAETVQQLVQQQVAQALAAHGQTFQQQLTRLEVNRMAEGYSGEINKAIAALKQEMPELASIPRLDRILKREVAERQPGSLEETLEALREVAGEFARSIKQQLGQATTAASVAKQSLAQGIEPPGGRGLAPAPQPDFTRVTDERLRNLVIQDLMKLQQGV